MASSTRRVPQARASKKGIAYLFIAFVIAGGLVVLGIGRTASGPLEYEGVVMGPDGPLAHATVRIGDRQHVVQTDAEGFFSIVSASHGEAVPISAWADGHYIARVGLVAPNESPLEIRLTPLEGGDDSDYIWTSPFDSSGHAESCEGCHSTPEVPASTMPFDEWLRDPHATSATNPRFLTMYLGTDMEGNQSPPTRFVSRRDYGRFPIGPDPTEPYYGPGYRLDWPSAAGNCASCHAPTASMTSPHGTFPDQIEDPASAGVTCDFCHKIEDVILDPNTGLPYPNRPAMLSYSFSRPPERNQFYASPYDNPMDGGSYTPVVSQSAFCAPCHFAEFWQTKIYNSYGEWLASDYSNPDTGQTCQDCHMPSIGASLFALPEVGGVEHPPGQVASHDMSVAGLLEHAVTLDATATREAELRLTVEITNDLTGHSVPTDSPLRHLILLVEAFDAAEKPLGQLAGPTLPDWCGVGDATDGYYAGRPGQAYAKVLEDIWTRESPTGSYWSPTRLLSDNRIAAHTTESTTYSFEAPASGPVTIHVRLYYRRAFRDLADQKGWDAQDILMEEETLQL